LHTLIKGHLTLASWVLMIRNQIANQIPSHSFGHKLCLKSFKGKCDITFDIYFSMAFQWFKEGSISIRFDI
jgi:hypothetical protein